MPRRRPTRALLAALLAALCLTAATAPAQAGRGPTAKPTKHPVATGTGGAIATVDLDASAAGLEADQSATLTAIRLRLEGKSRASLDDLLVAGKDLGGKDPLTEAMTRREQDPSFDDLVAGAERKPKKSLDDLL